MLYDKMPTLGQNRIQPDIERVGKPRFDNLEIKCNTD